MTAEEKLKRIADVLKGTAIICMDANCTACGVVDAIEEIVNENLIQ